MISFGNVASSHCELIPLKIAYKKRGELLWAIASKKNVINLHSAAFGAVFGRNLTIENREGFQQGLKYNQFFPQISCLPVSFLIIHWRCFQVSYTRAHLAKRQNLHQKGPSVKSPGYANYRVKRLVIHYHIRATLFLRVSVMLYIIKYCILHDEP